MAKKIIYEISGRIQEISSSQMSASDDGNSFFVDKISFNTASLNIQNGFLTVSPSGFLSSSNASSDGDVIAWNSAQNKWVAKSSKINISNLNAVGDVNNPYNNAKVRNLSNVSSGTLSVSNGGTGILKQDIVNLGNSSALLIGNGNSAPLMIKQTDINNLSNKPILSVNAAGNAWTTVTQSIFSNNVDVQIFTSSNGTQTWTKPQNTKFVRIVAAGGGGGGGSGATRGSFNVYCLGGAGGGGGELKDTGIFTIDDKLSTITMTIGTGGLGANTPFVIAPQTSSNGLPGNPGGTTYVNIGNTIITASGGFGGSGGLYNSIVTSSGGAGGNSGGSDYINNFVDNVSSLDSSGYSGQDSILTSSANASSLISYGAHSYNMRGGKLLGGGGGGSTWKETGDRHGGNSYFFIPPYPYDTSCHLFNFDNNVNDSLYLINNMIFTSYNLTYSTDYKKFGTHSARFNGTTSRAALNITNNQFTWYASSSIRLSLLECWVNVDDVTNNMTIASSNYNSGTRQLYFKILSGGKLQYYQKVTATAFTFNSNNSIKPNVWNHICFSLEYINSSTYYVRMHINGILDSTHTVTQNPDVWNGGTLFNVGSDITNLSVNKDFFKGYMDGLLLYSATTTGTTAEVNAAVNNLKNIFKYNTNFIPLEIPYTFNTTYGTSNYDALITTSSSLLQYYNLTSSNINLNSQARDLFLHSGGSGGKSQGSLIPSPPQQNGGRGGNGAWGSGGGGGGVSTEYFNSQIRQGGNGGNGYVVIISYKDF